jgi:hypothetical protein
MRRAGGWGFGVAVGIGGWGLRRCRLGVGSSRGCRLGVGVWGLGVGGLGVGGEGLGVAGWEGCRVQVQGRGVGGQGSGVGGWGVGVRGLLVAFHLHHVPCSGIDSNSCCFCRCFRPCACCQKHITGRDTTCPQETFQFSFRIPSLSCHV